MRASVVVLLVVISLSGLLTDGFLFSYKPPPRPAYECEPNPCKYNGTCHIDTEQKAVCSCAPGHHGQWCKLKTKKEADTCNPNPCGKGKCSMNGYAQVCTCPAKTLGAFCEATDPCAKSPCKNKGKCTVGKWNQSVCECVPGHHGRHCKEKTKKSVCDPNPCNHDGTCQVKKIGPGYLVAPVCTCKSWGNPALTPKYEGAFCDYRTRDPVKTECYPKNPCKNKGMCMVDLHNGDAVCSCPKGFHGRLCQIKTRANICDKNPCEHKGTCEVNKGNPTKFECKCTEFFYGAYCHKKTGCQKKTCKNKGVCTNLPNDLSQHFCTCDTNFKGDDCQYKDKCLTNKPCNLGTCQFDESTKWKPVCKCPLGFSGKKCANRECGIKQYKMHAMSKSSKKLYLDEKIDRKVHDLDGLLKLCRVTIMVTKSFEKNPSQTQQSYDWRDKTNQHFYIGQALEFEITDLKGKTYCNSLCLSDPKRYTSMPGAKCMIEGLYAIGLRWSILKPTVIHTGFATANINEYNRLRETHQAGCAKQKFP